MRLESLKFENKDQAARKELDSFRTRSNLLERNYRLSEEGANRSKETRIFRKRLESLKTRSKALQKN